jgi:hypothetical protein
MWTRLGYEMVSIPPCFTDLNPIENMFHMTRQKLKLNAIEQNITKENSQEFVDRVKMTYLQ